jgi:cardiolipin synthase
MTAANWVTLLRIVLIPCFGVLWFRGAHTWALVVFALAGVTDLLDGLMARLLDQKSRLGQLLDPAADKLLLLVSFLVAAAIGLVPRWLAALVIGRDVVLGLIGALLLALGRRRLDQFSPTRLGKYATFCLTLTIGLALLLRSTDSPAVGPYVGAMVLVSAALTACAGLQYLAMHLGALLSAKLARGRTP